VPEKLERDRAVADRVLAREAAGEMKANAEAAAIGLDGDQAFELAKCFGAGLSPAGSGRVPSFA
jgi:hypothetical protein